MEQHRRSGNPKVCEDLCVEGASDLLTCPLVIWPSSQIVTGQLGLLGGQGEREKVAGIG